MKKIMLFPILLLSLLSLLSCEKSRKSLGEKDVLGVWGLGVGLPEETFGVGVRRPKEPPPMLFRLFSNGDVWGYRYGNGSWIPKLNDYVDWETGGSWVVLGGKPFSIKIILEKAGDIEDAKIYATFSKIYDDEGSLISIQEDIMEWELEANGETQTFNAFKVYEQFDEDVCKCMYGVYRQIFYECHDYKRSLMYNQFTPAQWTIIDSIHELSNSSHEEEKREQLFLLINQNQALLTAMMNADRAFVEKYNKKCDTDLNFKDWGGFSNLYQFFFPE